MADKTVFEDDWFYFHEDVTGGKRRRNGLRGLTRVGLPSKVLQVTLAWFAEDETSSRLARLLAATLYYVKGDWEVFLRMHLKEYSQHVLVLCDGRKHAARLGVKTEWNFEEVPIAFDVSCPDPKDSEKESHPSLFVRLILGDEQRAYPEGELAQCALAWLNAGLLDKLGKIKNRTILVRRFARAVQEDIEELLG
jgi:hypothetical protein